LLGGYHPLFSSILTMGDSQERFSEAKPQSRPASQLDEYR